MNLAMGGRDGNADVGGEQNGEGGGNFDGEAGRRRDGREIVAHGVNDAFAEGDEAEGDAQAAVEEEPHGRRGLRLDRALLKDHPDGDEWSHGVADVVAAVRETAEARRQDLQVLEQLRNRPRVLAKIWMVTKREGT